MLVLILLGFVDVARFAFAYNNLENAARSGTRVAAVNQIETSPGCSRDTPIVDPTANPTWSIKACTVSEAVGLDLAAGRRGPSPTARRRRSRRWSARKGNLHVGCLVTVTVNYSLSPLTPVIGQMFPIHQHENHVPEHDERVFG